MTKKIAIIGCGWLGYPLAIELIKNGYKVNGTTTSINKITLLKEANIKPFLLELKAETPLVEMFPILEDIETLIINIPPRIRTNTSENYTQKIKQIHKAVEQSNIKNVLFVSSTSVYGMLNKTVNETDITTPTTESGKQILASENILLSLKNKNVTIIRFGGLIGSNRHPVHHLIKKEINKNGLDKINLIDLKDCISIIYNIIKNKVWNETFNAVTPYHPTKAMYYTKTAIDKKLKPPVFENIKTNSNKQISSKKLIDKLSYTFLNPTLD